MAFTSKTSVTSNSHIHINNIYFLESFQINLNGIKNEFPTKTSKTGEKKDMLCTYVLPAAMHVSSCRSELLSQKSQPPQMCEDLPAATRQKKTSYEVHVKENETVVKFSVCNMRSGEQIPHIS